MALPLGTINRETDVSRFQVTVIYIPSAYKMNERAADLV